MNLSELLCFGPPYVPNSVLLGDSNPGLKTMHLFMDLQSKRGRFTNISLNSLLFFLLYQLKNFGFS